jgi:hypothetical protein
VPQLRGGVIKLSELSNLMTIIDNWKNEIGLSFKNKGLFKAGNA